MNSRARTIGAALMLCALSICAFGAANASAVGLTAVKCVKEVGVHKYNSAECLTPAISGEFETVALAKGVTTEIEGQATTNEHGLGKTNEAEPAKSTKVALFKATASGLAIEITCSKTTGSGKVTNEEIEIEEEIEKGKFITVPIMAAHGTEAVVTYTECHASLQSDTTKVCKVQGTAPATAVGTIQTNPLTGINIGTEHQVEIKPEGALPFTAFTILKESTPNCFTKANVSMGVTGSVIAIANTTTHSHLTYEPATNGSKFLANGAAASFEATTTFWMKGAPTELVGGETF